jgi:GNAT superfamily N-acetyltransferase
MPLRDGTAVRVRPLTRDDRDELDAAIQRQSMQSRYSRFFTPVRRLPDAALDRLVDVDGRRHIALVLLGPGDEPIAIGHLIRPDETSDTAEITLAVDDAWQGRGAGSSLAHALIEAGRPLGVCALTASVRMDNAAALALLGSLGAVRSRRPAEPGVYDVEVALAG